MKGIKYLNLIILFYLKEFRKNMKMSFLIIILC